MRKLILFIAASLDGYIARADGALDWLPGADGTPPAEGDDMGYGALLARCDVALMGRKTYAFMRAHGEPEGVAGLQNILFSRTWDEAAEPVPPSVRREQRPLAEVVHELRAQPGRDLWLVGGGGLVREALAADLLDELELATVPVLLGAGIPLWVGGHADRHWRLVGSRAAGGLLLSQFARA